MDERKTFTFMEKNFQKVIYSTEIKRIG